VNGASYQFFTGSTFAVDQHRAGSGSDGADRLLQLLHGPAGADDILQRVVRSGIATQSKVLFA
jgi:hypothetical protein